MRARDGLTHIELDVDELVELVVDEEACEGVPIDELVEILSL